MGPLEAGPLAVHVERHLRSTPPQALSCMYYVCVVCVLCRPLVSTLQDAQQVNGAVPCGSGSSISHTCAAPRFLGAECRAGNADFHLVTRGRVFSLSLCTLPDHIHASRARHFTTQTHTTRIYNIHTRITHHRTHLRTMVALLLLSRKTCVLCIHVNMPYLKKTKIVRLCQRGGGPSLKRCVRVVLDV